MSRKLATQIKDSAIPGKWKRVAEAYAAFANDDGTNIYASKEKLGEKAGGCPDTIYRNTPDLLACGLLSVAESHSCKVENCNKGATHFTGRWGHYTTAYVLHIDQLQNAETYLSAKYQKIRNAKCRKVGVANCGTTLVLKETPASLSENLDSSAVPLDKETKKESLLAPLADVVREEQSKNLSSERPNNTEPKGKTNPKPLLPSVRGIDAMWRSRTERSFTAEERLLANDLIHAHSYRVVYAVLQNTLFVRPKSARLRWNSFAVFGRNWERNHDEYLAYCAVAKAEAKRKFTLVAEDSLVPGTSLWGKHVSAGTWVKERGKDGEWSLAAEEWRAMGFARTHLHAVNEYLQRDERRVTKDEYVALLGEAALQDGYALADGNSATTDESFATVAGFSAEEAE